MKKILAIDDNNINLELLSQIIKLNYPDYEFIGESSGVSGIEAAVKDNPELILLDIMMPGLDGYETCSLLKKDPKTKHIPILMVSALGRDSSERTKGLNAGADSFISKPFDQTELKAQINVALRIKAYQDQLKKLNTEITLVEEKERRRIAENLHDSLGQTLGLAFIHLSKLQENNFDLQTDNSLEFISKLINKAIDESRTLTYDLSPPILYELGLIPAIKWKLEQFEQDHGIKTSFTSENEGTQPKKEYAIFLYRIIGELLTNTFKHASASKVSVTQNFQNGHYHLTVADDGIGIKSSQLEKKGQNGGFGLLSISERIESLNGTFTIKSNQEGTVATIIVPIDP